MSLSLSVQIDQRGLAAIRPGPMRRPIVRALRKARATALRDMRSGASKRIKARKRIQSKYITRAQSCASRRARTSHR
jgi:hypothetical protein